jgi:hypothetical protein
VKSVLRSGRKEQLISSNPQKKLNAQSDWTTSLSGVRSYVTHDAVAPLPDLAKKSQCVELWIDRIVCAPEMEQRHLNFV